MTLSLPLSAPKVLRQFIVILLGGVLFTPLLITPQTLFPFQTGKGIAIRVLIEIAFLLCCWLIILDPARRPRSTPLFWATLSFGFMVVLSSLLSHDMVSSFWGDLERMEGVFGILHGVALFFILRTVLQTSEDWVLFLRVSVAASIPVALYAFGQVDPSFRFFSVYEARDLQPGSTLGHQSFLATYAIFQLFFGMILAVLEKAKIWRVFAAAGIVVNVIILGLTAVRGAQLALVAALAVGGVLFFFVNKNRKVRITLASVFAGLGLLVGLVFAAKDTTLIQKMPYAIQRMASISPDEPMAKTRIIALGVSWEAFKERPVFGWGQEHFAAAYNKHFDPDHLLYEQAWFDRAHNKVADVAVQNGILGLLAYCSMFLLAFTGLFRIVRRSEEPRRRITASVMIMLVTAYWVQNLFLFDMVVSTMFFFATVALTDWMAQTGLTRVAQPGERPCTLTSGRAIILTILTAGVIMLVLINVRTYETARLGRASVAARDPEAALEQYLAAMGSGGFAKTNATRALMDELLASGHVRQPEWDGVVESVRNQAELQMGASSPSVPMLIRLGKLNNERVQKNGEFFSDAERVLKEAIRLAPNRPDAYYELGVTHLKRGETEQGLAVFRSALELNIHNTRARWVLGLALVSAGKISEGLTEAENAITWGYKWKNPADIKNLTAVYEWLQRHERLVWMYEQVIDGYPTVAEYRASLARAYANTGNTIQAKEQMLAAVQLDRRYEPSATQFIQSLPFSNAVHRSTP